MVAHQTLLHVRILYEELVEILKQTAPQKAAHLIQALQDAVGIVTEAAHNPDLDEEKSKATLRELGIRHLRMNQPRVGLSDFFIWRDDFDERLEANRRLNEIRDEVWGILNQYC